MPHPHPPPQGPNHLIRCAAAWEEVAVIIAVQRHIQDTGVTVKGLLGAITMVHILEDRGIGSMRQMWHTPWLGAQTEVTLRQSGMPHWDGGMPVWEDEDGAQSSLDCPSKTVSVPLSEDAKPQPHSPTFFLATAGAQASESVTQHHRQWREQLLTCQCQWQQLHPHPNLCPSPGPCPSPHPAHILARVPSPR